MKTSCLFILLLTWAGVAQARPYRLINARTPRTAAGGDLEIGLRYQGMLAGDGYGGFDPRDFHQLAATLRWGIIDQFELEFEASAIIFHDDRNPGPVTVDPGDLKLDFQVRFIDRGPALLGLFFGVTFPTGPSDVDVLPPFFADGTLDFAGLLLFEVAPRAAPVRLVFDAGYEANGTRHRPGRGDFDVPDDFRYDAAFAVHVGWRFLFSLELNGRYYFERRITPVWTDNQHILELTPGLRIEIVPRLVLEAGAGFGLNDDTRQMFKIRPQVGLTYEFPVY